MKEEVLVQNTRSTSVFDEEDHLLNRQQLSHSHNIQSNGKLTAIIVLLVIGILAYLTYANINKHINNSLNKTISPVLEILEPENIQKDNSTKMFEAQPTKQKPQQQKIVPDLTQQPKEVIDQQTQVNNSQSEKSPQSNTQPISEQAYNQRIYAGQIHYSRIPVEYWEHRILMLKAMGLNTLSVYVMWNYHEKQRGVFDYQTQNKNLTKFLELAVKHKMKFLLRPGPYICGEWDLGGLPARLLGIQDLKIRTYNEEYLKEVEIYFKSLAPIIKPFLLINNGPIHLIQIQNELGSFASDKPYTLALVKMWKDLQIESQHYIQDSPRQVFKNYFKGAAIGISGGNKHQDYQIVSKIQQLQSNTRVFSGQVYTGWMTHWGQKWGENPKYKVQMQFLFKQHKQFSLYMAYGGTNFGLTAGANAQMHGLSYEPMITSYDYDATITQQGRTTYKSDFIVELMKKYIRPPSIPFPQPINTISIEQIQPKLTASLLAHLGQPDLKQMSELYYFEHPKIGMYNQGIVVYQTYITQGNYSFDLMIHDFALVFIDDRLIYTFARIKSDTFDIEIECGSEKCRVLVLVQAMGHNNYGRQQQLDIKGLIFCEINLLRLQSDPLKIKASWNLYKININESLLSMNKIGKEGIQHPAIFKQTFNISEIGDTYIDMHKYKKGYVWINGRNLGRYWNRGPQFRLYCPGVWLKKKNNQIVILELLSSQQKTVNGKHKLNDLN